MTILLLMAANYGLYAEAFLERLKHHGAKVIVVTGADALGLDWPKQHIDAIYGVSDFFDRQSLLDSVTYLLKETAVDRILGLGEYDIEIAAWVREELGYGGASVTQRRFWRDKLAMRTAAKNHNIPVPPFTSVIHFPAVADFLNTVQGPWILKPRALASSKGITVFQADQTEQLWQALHDLGDKTRDYILEKFIPGDVFHLDGLVYQQEVILATAHRYGRPILDLHTHGGIYTTLSLDPVSPLNRELLALNEKVISTLGIDFGSFHVEYILGHHGQLYFLEGSCRVGAGGIEQLVEAERGLNLWAEWATMEYLTLKHERYQLPELDGHYAAVVACSTTMAHPDVTPFLFDGVTSMRDTKPYHMGFVVRAESEDMLESRVQQLEQLLKDHNVAVHIN
jgi:biotin carboxylase